jgi:hypothetical protein
MPALASAFALPPVVVWRAGGCYLVDDPSLVPLIGADAHGVPLLFSDRARLAVVLAHVRRCHPGRTVRFDPERCS